MTDGTMAKKKRRVWIETSLCKGTEGCGLCVDVCPEGVLGVSDTLSSRGVHPAVIADIESCVGCEQCVLRCPELALALEQVG